MRFWYRATRLLEQTHCLVGWLKYPQGHGFMAATRAKFAGNVTVPPARLIVTTCPPRADAGPQGWHGRTREARPETGLLGGSG